MMIEEERSSDRVTSLGDCLIFKGGLGLGDLESDTRKDIEFQAENLIVALARLQSLIGDEPIDYHYIYFCIAHQNRWIGFDMGSHEIAKRLGLDIPGSDAFEIILTSVMSEEMREVPWRDLTAGQVVRLLFNLMHADSLDCYKSIRQAGVSDLELGSALVGFRKALVEVNNPRFEGYELRLFTKCEVDQDGFRLTSEEYFISWLEKSVDEELGWDSGPQVGPN